MSVTAVITGLSTYYVDGVERQEIWIHKHAAAELPYCEGQRVAVRLTVGSMTLNAGIRATARTPEVWICPDLYDEAGNKVRLADALRHAGFAKNDRVRLRVSGLTITLEDLLGGHS